MVIDEFYKEYLDLISFWVGKNLSPGRGREKHHIIPKCLGGDNSKNNLVVLPTKYHVEAHVLLHYAYPEDKKLALAVILMFRTRDVDIKRAETIALARDLSRKYLSQLISGRNHPRYTREKYEFINRDGREVYCTPHELYSTIDKTLDSNLVSRIARGNTNTKSHKGWYIKGRDKGRGKKFDDTVYLFINKKKEVVESTRYRLYTEIDTRVEKSHLSRVLKGERKSVGGWTCLGCLI